MTDPFTPVMKCENCAHWAGLETGFGSDWQSDFGICKYTPNGPSVAIWSKMGNWVLGPSHEDRTAVVHDASENGAELLTKPDHFCAMFRPKPKEATE